MPKSIRFTFTTYIDRLKKVKAAAKKERVSIAFILNRLIDSLPK